MRILVDNYQRSFKSKNNPISPFIVKTLKGELTCFEISSKDLYKSKKLFELSHFFCKNFASLTEDPYWLKYNNAEYRDQIAVNFYNYLNRKVLNDDGNLTMLVAEDKNNQTQAACLSYTYDDLPEQIKNVCYIDSIAVNHKYRKNDIAKTFFNKISELNKNTFTDLFLTGEILAKKFYEKIGFKKLDDNDPTQRNFIRYLQHTRGDEMLYLIPFNKSLQETKQKWFSIFND